LADKVSGIYLLRNTVNEKCYVGQSVDIHKRWRQHKSSAASGCNFKFSNAIRKYGPEAFELVVLEECSYETFDEREAYWMDHYSARENGYNQMPAGQRGRVCDDAMRETIASKLRGRKLPPEVIEKIRIANIGKLHTEETKEKISLANKGRAISPEVAEKLSLLGKQRWENLSKEDRQAYAEKRSGWKQPDYVKEATRKRFLGKPKSEETKQKIREARLNVSPEKDALRLSRIREANQKRWAAYREAKGIDK